MRDRRPTPRTRSCATTVSDDVDDAYLPPSVDGERVTIAGVVDLVHVTPDRVERLDSKTDRGRHGEAEYRKQLSVYY